MSTTALRTERSHAKLRITLVGAGINLALAAGKVAAGIYGRSSALIVDGLHSLSDLATDILVFFTLHLAGQDADDTHPYGHGRFETAAAMVLGLILAAVAAGVIWDAAQRLQEDATLWQPSYWTPIIAALSILIKEGLYRYTLHVAHCTRSRLLVANAWHHRSDAVSSIVVLIGLAGSLYGYRFADSVAAIVVGLMIVKIGLELVLNSAQELVDTALPAVRVQQIEQAILTTEGVKALHCLRTRQMAGEALLDVHLEVSPEISVSEGHAIADKVRDRLLEQFEEVYDVTVHIDAERDLSQPSLQLPLRSEVLAYLHQVWRDLAYAKSIEKINLHYLQGKIHVEVYLPLSILTQSDLAAEEIVTQLRRAITDLSFLGGLSVYFVAA
ncbi:MAG: cation diffusion facilitator family transporter [Methylohalobius sp.]|nr:cation diffusion facilitator family transporter [Methylohalobius sp.]